MSFNLIYPHAYHAFKGGPCMVGVCKHDAECGKCEYGDLRAYAARDVDCISKLKTQIGQLKRIKHFVSFIVANEEAHPDDLEMLREWLKVAEDTAS